MIQDGSSRIIANKDGAGYETFLVHLYDLLEDKINAERYDEAVRQLVGNQVSRLATCEDTLCDKGYVLRHVVLLVSPFLARVLTCCGVK